jgi:hypothetical protein
LLELALILKQYRSTATVIPSFCPCHVKEAPTYPAKGIATSQRHESVDIVEAHREGAWIDYGLLKQPDPNARSTCARSTGPSLSESRCERTSNAW